MFVFPCTHMNLASTAFEHNTEIPPRYTCDGENESPPLSIGDMPPETRSLALIVHDPDAVSGDFTHWIIWNIPADTIEILAGMPPESAMQGTNDFGNIGYGGPCPPKGTGIHHYHFVLSALDTVLDLDASAKRDDLLMAMEGHELARNILIGLYQNEDEGMVSG